MSATAVVAALRAPIDQLLAAVDAAGPAGVVSALHQAHTAVGQVGDAIRQAWSQVADAWSGLAADTAWGHVTGVGELAQRLAERSGALVEAAQSAGNDIAAARTDLQRIADEFTTRAEPFANRLDDPEAVRALLVLVRTALDDALSAMVRLQDALDGHTQTVTSTMPTAAASAPAALSSPVTSPHTANIASYDRPVELPTGGGIAVTLPDGSRVLAPNPLAASAVEHALTQLGVPYDWGGTTPGVGLDCSGLTQWAYGEAGLGLPRLAQEQDIGAAVSGSSLMPGDLAVWDGHVAMVVGNNMMIEAGDPVQLSSIRTTNAGQGFQGFWRPTA